MFVTNSKSPKYLVFWRKMVTSFVGVWSRAVRTISKRYTSGTVNSHRQKYFFFLEYSFMIFSLLYLEIYWWKITHTLTEVAKWQITCVCRELVLISNLGMTQNIVTPIFPSLMLLVSSTLCRVLLGESASKPTARNGLGILILHIFSHYQPSLSHSARCCISAAMYTPCLFLS